MNELVKQLFRFTKEYREDALEEITKIHPHRDIILNYANNDGYIKDESRVKGKFSAFEMEENIDFTGGKSNDSSPKNTMQTINDYLPLIAVAGLFALTITAISK